MVSSSARSPCRGRGCGDGNRREVAGVTHKGEMVMNHKTTSKYRDVLEGVHKGRINLNEWRDKVNMFEALTNGKRITGQCVF